MLATNAKLREKWGKFFIGGKFRDITVTLPTDAFEGDAEFVADYSTWSVGPSEKLEDKVGQMLVKKSVALWESENNSDDEEDDDDED